MRGKGETKDVNAMFMVSVVSAHCFKMFKGVFASGLHSRAHTHSHLQRWLDSLFFFFFFRRLKVEVFDDEQQYFVIVAFLVG